MHPHMANMGFSCNTPFTPQHNPFSASGSYSILFVHGKRHLAGCSGVVPIHLQLTKKYILNSFSIKLETQA